MMLQRTDDFPSWHTLDQPISVFAMSMSNMSNTEPCKWQGATSFVGINGWPKMPHDKMFGNFLCGEIKQSQRRICQWSCKIWGGFANIIHIGFQTSRHILPEIDSLPIGTSSSPGLTWLPHVLVAVHLCQCTEASLDTTSIQRFEVCQVCSTWIASETASHGVQ